MVPLPNTFVEQSSETPMMAEGNVVAVIALIKMEAETMIVSMEMEGE